MEYTKIYRYTVNQAKQIPLNKFAFYKNAFVSLVPMELWYQGNGKT